MVTTMQRAPTTEHETTSSLIASDRVEGTAVYDAHGKRIGKVERLVIDKASGSVAYAVLSFGGFLGIGADHYPIPWSMLNYDEKLGGYRVDITDAAATSPWASVAFGLAQCSRRTDNGWFAMTLPA